MALPARPPAAVSTTEIWSRERYGFAPCDLSANASNYVTSHLCPIDDKDCKKEETGGICSVTIHKKSGTLVNKVNLMICEKRILVNNTVVNDVINLAFGTALPLYFSPNSKRVLKIRQYPCAIAFSQVQIDDVGTVDWIIAKSSSLGVMDDIVFLETQTIDTTNNYSDLVSALDRGACKAQSKTVGLNEMNVFKRLIVQILIKGTTLQAVPNCTKGLFFAAPTYVYDDFMSRLGFVHTPTVPLSKDTVTFLGYSLAKTRNGVLSDLVRTKIKTVEFDRLADRMLKAHPGVTSTVVQDALSGRIRKLRS